MVRHGLMKGLTVAALVVASALYPRSAQPQEQDVRPMRKEILIDNLQRYPLASFFAAIWSQTSGRLVDVFVFRMNGGPLYSYYPGCVITLHWARNSDLRRLCGNWGNLTECLIEAGEYLFDDPAVHAAPGILESTDVWSSEDSGLAAQRSVYTIAVNLGSGPAIVIYPSRLAYGYEDGSVITQTFRKPYFGY